MFGYATNETETIHASSNLFITSIVKRLSDVRKDGTLNYLRPDGKVQVTVEYDENDNGTY